MEKRTSWKRWENPGDPHLMNRIQWNFRELESMQQVFDADWFGYGAVNKDLEKKLATYTGVPYFNLTNSGSTALTTAIKVLYHSGRLKRGDLVIHPVTTFPTSISAALDYGLIPIFIETRADTYVADEAQVERAVQKFPSARAMILPHLLGNIPNMDRIRSALGDRILIEDCCDTLGGTFNGRHVGSFGDFMALSFYGSHHISAAGVGGALGTPDEKLSQLAKSIIFWGHDYDTHDTNGSNDKQKDFLARYDCQTIGSDFQLSAIQAAFALAQMDRLPDFVLRREKQFQEMDTMFKENGYFNTPVSDTSSRPSWFCYPVTIKPEAPFKRRDFVEYLTDRKVETRPIMCGNLLKQAPYSGIKRITLDRDNFPIGDAIQETGMFLPCWGMPDNQKADYYRILQDFLGRNKY
jgi:CDP-6-deoxy-D-xylo-4-hexulose-3-dehydrase